MNNRQEERIGVVTSFLSDLDLFAGSLKVLKKKVLGLEKKFRKYCA